MGAWTQAEEAAGDGRTALEIMPALFDREIDAHHLGFALGETIAHLNHLVFRDRLERHVDNKGRHIYSTTG